MALILGTVLYADTLSGNPKDPIPWGTPYEKLTKAEQKYARENNLLIQVPDPIPTLEEELDSTVQFDDQETDDEDLVQADSAEDTEAE